MEVQFLLNEFSDTCSPDLPSSVSPLRDIQHCIDFFLGSKLPNLAHYKMSPKVKQILQSMIEDLLQREFIQPSMSPCSVPALWVKKRSWWMCINIKVINKILMKYLFMMPHFKDLIDNFSGSIMFFKLDLQS